MRGPRECRSDVVCFRCFGLGANRGREGMLPNGFGVGFDGGRVAIASRHERGDQLSGSHGAASEVPAVFPVDLSARAEANGGIAGLQRVVRLCVHARAGLSRSVTTTASRV